MPKSTFKGAVRRILRPLVRAMIGRGLTFPELSQLLKELYVEEAQRSFRLERTRVTDSRISLLTGLQRRDVKAIRAASTQPEESARAPGPVSRVLALWSGDPAFLDTNGVPRTLPRNGPSPSFEALVAEVGRDVHARTILDELLRLELARIDDEDRVVLRVEALVPSPDEHLLITYFANNLGDHAEAAASNILAAPAPGPFFERAVHYNQLTQASVDALEDMARSRAMEMLSAMNAEAMAMQRADAGNGDARMRFRTGAFVFQAAMDDEAKS
ncbi:MAG: DUF6502 family protein [Pseudomonadota bacterium]